MYFAIDTPNFGDYSEPRLLAELAKEAEEAGWDGFFLWDHIGADWTFPVGDPWIALAAMAMATERIKLGPLVTPMPPSSRCRYRQKCDGSVMRSPCIVMVP